MDCSEEASSPSRNSAPLGGHGRQRSSALAPRFALLALLALLSIASITTEVLNLASYVRYRYLEPGIGVSIDVGGGRSGMLTGQWFEPSNIRLSRGVRVRSVDDARSAARAGLASGDLIVKVNGIDLARKPEAYYRPFSVGREGDRVRIEFERAGELRETTIVLERVPPKAWGLSFNRVWIDFGPLTTWVVMGPRLIVCLVLLLVGVLMGLLGTAKRAAFDLAVVGIALSYALMLSTFPLIRSMPLTIFAVHMAVDTLCNALFSFFLLRSFASFPHPSGLGRLVLRAQWGLACVLVLLSIADMITTVPYYLSGPIPGLSRSPILRTLGGLTGDPLALFAIVAALALLLAQRIETRAARGTRFKVIEFGFFVGAAGGILMEVYYLWLAGLRMSPTWQKVCYFAGAHLGLLLVCAFPISLAYAVLARRVPGLQLIIRKGVQHLLLSKGTLVVEGLLIFAVVFGILRQATRSGVGSEGTASGVAVVSALAVVGALAKVNRRLMPVIDRRFFKERCDVGALLLDLGRRLPTIRQREQILRHTAATVMGALYPSEVSLLLRDPLAGAFRCEAHLTADQIGHAAQGDRLEAQALPRPDLELRESDGVVDRLAGGEPWIEVHQEEFSGSYQEEAGSGSRDEEARLSDLGTELLVSIAGTEALRGILSLGPKLSEEPYTREDKDLLLTVCRQVGTALENAELLEVAKREAQQARDLEIAHQVQQTLFPREFPVRPGWAFAAMCRPARATGGDYYDLLELPSGKIAFALGDVAGKGLGASLLTASVHAIVRSGLREEAPDLGRLVSEVNEHLYTSSAPQMFVTLFIGILNPDDGELRYVNGGHPPPLLIGTLDTAPIRLEAGGTIVGIMPGVPFREEAARIESGNFLLLFSDGVTEAMDRGGEMFEEERLVMALASVKGRPAAEIKDALVEAVDRFASGCEQADDISVVVIQRTC
ncbi:MAG: PDZ domain-containing protein [Candidatus Eisenbacteria bacterium]|nr:PDZ domain-containing protein [Candidatus Eisenbacteria bacterium]